MRVVLWIGVALGVLWAAYWFVGSYAVKGAVVSGFTQTAGQEVLATNGGVAVAGFPNRFDLTVTTPEVSDKAAGWAWKAPFAQVFAMTWKPWNVIAALPNDQTLTVAGQTIGLHSSRMMGSLLLEPTTALALKEVVVESEGLLATSDLGWKVGVEKLVLASRADPATRNAQEIGLDITALTPDPALAAMLPELGPTVSVVHLDAILTLTAPIDRTMANTQPQISGVEVKDFRANWGALQITASGKIAPGADGLAEGSIDIAIKGWRNVPALIAAAGWIDPGAAKPMENALASLAKSGKDPEVLSLPLTFQKGWMNLGPLPLGPSPRMAQ